MNTTPTGNRGPYSTNQYNSSKRGGEDRFYDFSINATDLPANAPQYLLMPEDGFIRGLKVVVQVKVTGGGAITVKTVPAGSGATGGAGNFTNTVAGIAAAIPTGSDVGFAVDSPAASQDVTTTFLRRGDAVQITPAGFGGAGAVRCELVYNTALPQS